MTSRERFINSYYFKNKDKDLNSRVKENIKRLLFHHE